MNKINEGFNLVLYSRFFDEFVVFHQELKDVGHLMVDEMKLKAGILFNRSNDVQGSFCESDGFKLHNKVKDVLRGGVSKKKVNADEEEEPDIITYVNQ